MSFSPSSLLAAESLGGKFHVPSLDEMFEYPPYWFSQDWGIFQINRTVMLTLLGTAIASLFMIAAFRSPKLVPGKLQAIGEAIVEFVREQIAVQVIGPDGVKWVPFLTTIFLFVWVQNLFEILPLVNFPTTSRMALPAFLAGMVWLTFIGVGMKAQGPLHYLKNTAFPPGVPAPIYILVTPIEIVSTFLVRPLTLSVRLFANMLAGHIILTIIFVAASAFLIGPFTAEGGSLAGLPVGLVAFAASPLLVGFELLVGFLQAYIFTILTAVYIGGALHPEH